MPKDEAYSNTPRFIVSPVGHFEVKSGSGNITRIAVCEIQVSDPINHEFLIDDILKLPNHPFKDMLIHLIGMSLCPISIKLLNEVNGNVTSIIVKIGSNFQLFSYTGICHRDSHE